MFLLPEPPFLSLTTRPRGQLLSLGFNSCCGLSQKPLPATPPPPAPPPPPSPSQVRRLSDPQSSTDSITLLHLQTPSWELQEGTLAACLDLGGQVLGGKGITPVTIIISPWGEPA